MSVIMNPNDLSLGSGSLTRNIDLALIRAFVAVADMGGMTTAARFLNLTQGAISQQIKRLEELLQKPLFDRSGGRLTLTADGERLLLHAQKLLSLNDEVFGLMTAPDFEGEIKLGMPHDIVSPYAAPILSSFNKAWPRVRVGLMLMPSKMLKQELANGTINLILTTEAETPRGAERLITDRLVWVGAKGGEAYQRTPLPLALCHEICLFRPIMSDALGNSGHDWHLVSAMPSMDATFAMLKADIAVTAFLESTVPDYLEILKPSSGLPALSEFAINLYLPKAGTNEIAQELARHIREQFARWFTPQAAAAS